MKRIISGTTLLFVLIATILTACKKEKPEIVTQPGEQPAFLQFTLNLPGSTEPGNFQHALITVTDEQDRLVLKDKKVPVWYSGSYSTEKIALPPGNYKLTGFLLVDSLGRAGFASPMVSSARASSVTRSLPLSFSLPQLRPGSVGVDLLTIVPVDTEESFGYAAGSFHRNQGGQDGGTPDNDPFFRILVRASMKVGDISYDSIPASLTLTTWDSKNQMTTSYMGLKAGTNEISLSKSQVKYELLVSWWGMSEKLTLQKNELQAGHLYVIGTARAAKLLKSETKYILQDGQYIPDNRAFYVYDNRGRLARINYFQNLYDHDRWKNSNDRFVYLGDVLQRVDQYDSKDSLLGSLSFGYDAQGRVSAMKDNRAGVQTEARVEYTPVLNRTDVRISYRYSNTIYTMDYYKSYVGGNVISDGAFTSNLNSETGTYSYDFNINPYAFMNWPDLYLSHDSRHNRTGQQKTYQYAYPSMEPYSNEYVYDAEGYPRELVQKYRSPIDRKHLTSVKTVYSY